MTTSSIASKYNIILGSGSPRRKELLSRIGLTYEVVTSKKEETIVGSDPSEIVMNLADEKSLDVWNQLQDSNHLSENTLLITADTIVVLDGKILGKPSSEENAKDMILSIQGRTHCVYTGVCIRSLSDTIHFYETTDVTICPMTDDEIDEYIATGEPMDKAGSYGIQGSFCQFVEKINGDYFNVMGLPVSHLMKELRHFSK